MIAGSNSAGGMELFSLVSVVCSRGDVTAIGRSLVQSNTTEGGVSKCDIETSTTTRPISTRFVEPRKKNTK